MRKIPFVERCRILKYRLSCAEKQRLMLPMGAQIHATFGSVLQNQNDTITFWAQVPYPHDGVESPWDFHVVLTGDVYVWDSLRFRPMGTVQIDDSVYHVFVHAHVDDDNDRSKAVDAAIEAGEV